MRTAPDPLPRYLLTMDNRTIEEIRRVLVKQGKRELARAFMAEAATGPDQIASMLNGIVNQVRGHIRTASGQMSYYIGGAGADQLDDKAKRALQAARNKLDGWERAQLKGLHDIAQDVKKIK